ncbi:hypothetical protein SAMN05421678_12619 [Actinopolymorpha cephalotaxi]|uniref:Uncharacterized protein n=1 Tax=Actinopolymorpha cephalotaxi TaxID=504797 RepID=A0A1I3BRF0_9ACTN|nr:hypothetical protein [Actinopolymorpha cephalotaxi]NYH83770.1 hypothetical protein [Actinopolymorpha cephalotaxi]SFH64750.1 hypothetical protein SAMN05421678_12619 [Actinopolymorpha cephalotaxi]
MLPHDEEHFLGYTSPARNSIYTMRTDGSDIRGIPNTETSESPDRTQK